VICAEFETLIHCSKRNARGPRAVKNHRKAASPVILGREQAMAQRWNPIPSVVFGLALGVLSGALLIWGTDGGDRWQDQAGTVLEMTMVTTVACMAVAYVRQFISS
jgi:Na+-transporting NADH:ubiquinone oxidoreductase subunit NqrD